jgi:hypothetical protein
MALSYTPAHFDITGQILSLSGSLGIAAWILSEKVAQLC